MQSEARLKQYIDHAEALKNRYQKANLAGRHTAQIAKINRDIQAARQKLAGLR